MSACCRILNRRSARFILLALLAEDQSYRRQPFPFPLVFVFVLVSAAAAAIVMFILFIGFVKVQRGIAGREANVDRKTQVLAQVGRLAQGYRQTQAEWTQVEAKLKGPPLQLMSFVSQAGQRLGIEVTEAQIDDIVSYIATLK